MNPQAIDKAFEELIFGKNAAARIGRPRRYVRLVRYYYRRNRITYDLKITLLRKSGWQPDDIQYGSKDMISVLKFAFQRSQVARELGPEYILDEWKKLNHLENP